MTCSWDFGRKVQEQVQQGVQIWFLSSLHWTMHQCSTSSILFMAFFNSFLCNLKATAGRWEKHWPNFGFCQDTGTFFASFFEVARCQMLWIMAIAPYYKRLDHHWLLCRKHCCFLRFSWSKTFFDKILLSLAATGNAIKLFFVLQLQVWLFSVPCGFVFIYGWAFSRAALCLSKCKAMNLIHGKFFFEEGRFSYLLGEEIALIAKSILGTFTDFLA